MLFPEHLLACDQVGLSSFSLLDSFQDLRYCFSERLREYMEFRRASFVAQTVKNLPAMKETWVKSLGHEGPLEKGMATHFSILPWRIPWIEGPDQLQFMGHKELDMTE